MLPINPTPYKADPRQRKLKKNKIDQMLKVGVAKPVTTEWASPIIFVPKKDGSLWFCAGYRGLNAVTERERYPILRMDASIDSLGEVGSIFYAQYQFRQRANRNRREGGR